MKTEDILDMIDHTISDYTSPDAMRWTPEPPPKPKREKPWVRGVIEDAIRDVQRSMEVINRIPGPLLRIGPLEFGPGTITTVDPHTGRTVVTPFVRGSVTPVTPLLCDLGVDIITTVDSHTRRAWYAVNPRHWVEEPVTPSQ